VVHEVSAIVTASVPAPVPVLAEATGFFYVHASGCAFAVPLNDFCAGDDRLLSPCHRDLS
jgi:hypothetical protein